MNFNKNHIHICFKYPAGLALEYKMKQGKGYKILPREHTEEQKGEAFIRWLLTVIGQGKPH